MEEILEQISDSKILELFGNEYFELDKQYQKIITEENKLTTEQQLQEIDIQYQEMMEEKAHITIQAGAINRVNMEYTSMLTTRERQKRQAQYQREKQAKLTRYSEESTIMIPPSVYAFEDHSKVVDSTLFQTCHPKSTSIIAEYQRRKEIKAVINPEISNRQMKKQLYKEKLQASKQKKMYRHPFIYITIN